MAPHIELPGPLVDPSWLRERLGEPGLVVADVRMAPGGEGRPAFERGHLPGAVYLDVDADLSAPPEGDDRGRHPLPDLELFAEAMRRSGIDDDDAVVAYDDVEGSSAARLWWLLDAIGHPVALLDGSLRGWTGPLETGPQTFRPPGWFSGRPWPEERVVRTPEAERIVAQRSATMLDARSAVRYRGEDEPIDPIAGHIPGAISAPYADNVDASTGRFHSAIGLRERYERLGVARADDVVAYCGSGVTAAHDVFAMRLAGLGEARLYEGSWSGWIAAGDRPLATGPRPG
jgi:thiosulfate/3-mercaptopyruvate sulfurtransferase